MNFSVLGDSISTYRGWSDDVLRNATTAGYPVAYGPTVMDVRATWWHRLIEYDGLTLCVNNSYSGSTVGPSGDGATGGAYEGRAVNLHRDGGEEPELILFFMGANDYKNHTFPVGRWQGEGSDPPENFAQAYGLTLARMRGRYPKSRIVCLSVLPNTFNDFTRADADGSILARYCTAIGSAAHAFGAEYLDLRAETGITAREHARFYRDGLHPNALGMEKIYEAVRGAVFCKR